MKRVFYNSLGTEEMYGLIRDAMPAGYELVTLETDEDEERCQKIQNCEVAVVAAKPMTSSIIKAAGALQLIHHQGVGYHDTVDTQSLVERGIRLALTPAGTAIGVAEHTVLLTLAAAKRLAFADSELRQGRWHINSLRPVSVEIHGKTVGYIGFGMIGQAAAERFKVFGTKGLYFDPYAAPDKARDERLGVKPADFAELLVGCDIISVHTPLTEETHHLISFDQFEMMKPTAILVNTARGPVVHEQALVRALQSHQILAAGIDVFETEPVSPDNPLCRLDNIVMTPHISAGTVDALKGKMRSLFENVERFFRCEPLENEVTLTD
jgi:phosphoglycerate dehydrogenase-like enzyme